MYNHNNHNNNIHTFISLNLDGILLSNMKYNEEIHQRKKSELGKKNTHNNNNNNNNIHTFIYFTQSRWNITE